MKICICSDTHGDAQSLRVMMERERPEAVFFLGDGLRDLWEPWEFPETALYSVCGNCDQQVWGVPHTQKLTLDGVGFFLCHGHLYGVKTSLYGLRRAASEEYGVVCYGHTHEADIRAEDGRLYICPGSLGRPYHSYAVLETGETLHYGIRMLYI